MLKNKKAIYLLIPLNIFIWGFFAYRILSAFDDTEEVSPVPVAIAGKIPQEKDTARYLLRLGYKDPFLKESRQETYPIQRDAVVRAQVQEKSKTSVVKQVTAIQKPAVEIKYMGLIKNTTTGSTTALVTVNGQSRLIKQNESVDGIVFKSFNRDSLVAKLGKDRIVVRK